MDRQATGWTVTGVGFAIAAALYQGVKEPNSAVTGLLVVVATGLITYGVILVSTRRHPKVDIYPELVGAGVWRSDEETAYQVELSVELDWHSPVQIRFTLLLEDGTPIDNDDYHRLYIQGVTPPDYWDNPKKCDVGVTGPFKIAFIVPASLISTDDPLTDGLELQSRSVLDRLKIDITQPLVVRR